MPSGRKELQCILRRQLFDVGLATFSPGKGIHYGRLRCFTERTSQGSAKVLYTLPSRENFPRQWLAPQFLWQIFSPPYTVPHFLSCQGAWLKLCYHFKYNLHHIKILACIIVKASPHSSVCSWEIQACLAAHTYHNIFSHLRELHHS